MRETDGYSYTRTLPFSSSISLYCCAELFSWEICWSRLPFRETDDVKKECYNKCQRKRRLQGIDYGPPHYLNAEITVSNIEMKISRHIQQERNLCKLPKYPAKK